VSRDRNNFWYRSVPGGLQSTGVAVSPHAEDAQHGSAVAALVARAAELNESPVPMDIVRITVDLSRRVPNGLTTTSVDVRRAGKRVQVLDVTVLVDGRPYSFSQVVRMRGGAVLDSNDLPPSDPPVVEDPARRLDVTPWGESSFMRSVRPSFESWEQSSARYWVTMDDQMIDGEPMSPYVRAAAAADLSLSGGRLAPDHPSTNTDLHIAFHRPPSGTRFLIESEIQVTPNGWGSSVSTLSDAHGRVASLTKSILFLGFS